MSGNAIRREAIKAVTVRDPEQGLHRAAGDLFAKNVFGLSDEGRLPKGVFKSVLATIEKGAPLDPTIADAVASAMRDWALENGASHYAHVFYPLTGLTAEKHDSFLEPSATAARWRSSPARPSCRASPTAPASPTVASAAPSRPAVTPAGT